MRKIVYYPLVIKKDIPALDASMKLRIKSAIENKLMTSPEIFGIPLRQSLHGYRKLRVGDYRIIFFLEKERVIIFAILHRSYVYQIILSRIT
jgi:mRNA interferase RelE/StbE